MESKDREAYNNIVQKLKDIGVITVGFTYEYYIKNKSPRNRTDVKIIFKCTECGEEFTRLYSNMIKKDRRKVCLKCCKKHRKSKMFTIDELREKIKNKGLELLSDNYNGETGKIMVMCSCGNVYETTYASIRNSGKSGICRCKDCAKEYSREYFRVTFEEVRKNYEDNGCTLLSTEDEYVNIWSELTYIAKCGHINKSSVRAFNISKHKLCLKCSKKINQGENAYNWNPNLTPEEREKERSVEGYSDWVKAVYKKDDYTCKYCGKRGGHLNAHHLDGYNWCKKKRTDVENGVTLCEKCHKKFHKIYGFGDNTKEQFQEFIKLK